MKKLLLALVCCGAASPADRAEIPARLTLEQAMEIAFRSSTALARADALQRQAEGQAGQARSPLLPQVSLALNDTLQTVNLRAMGIDIPFAPSRVGPFQSVDGRAYVTQNVFNAAARQRNLAGREQLRSATALRENAREVLAWQVALAFAQALRAQSSAAAISEQAGLSRRLHAITEERMRAGVASLLEVKRSRQQVNHLEQALAEAGHALTAAKLELAHLVQARVTADYELAADDLPEATVPAPDAAITAALASRPDHRAAEAQVRAAERRVHAIKAQRYPVVQFQADYGQSGRKPLDNLNTFHVRGVLSVPLFTGGRIAAEQTEAEGKLHEAQAARDEMRSQVELEVLAALSQWEAARKQLEAASGTVSLAREELELAMERLTSGVSDNTELVNAQDRLSRAEDNRVRAEFQLDTARAHLFRAQGVAERSYRKAGARP